MHSLLYSQTHTDVLIIMDLVTSTKTASSCSSYTGGSSGGRPRYRYQVFLSFRGEDTRKNFTGHLFTAFSKAGFSTFLDDNELPRGEDIKSEIRSAIQQSQSSVIVFSKNFAFSRWCLDELVMILERRRMFGQVVLPVFYNVDPSHLRKQTGRVAEAFGRHERNQSVRHKVEGWREALAEVADLAGMVLLHGHEAKFIEKIVKVMDDKLSRMPLSVARDPIGIHSQVEKINFWLRNGSTEVDVLGIYGMRGIGKTTIAEFVYNSNRTAFGASSFLQNISESSRTPSGLIEMQQKLLFDLTEVKKGRIHTIEEGRMKIEDAIGCRRVLLVLDDVDHGDQLDAIFMMQSQFCPGSKVIITTNNAGLLRGARHQHIMLYAIQTLGDNESLKLFSWYAFGQDYPHEDYTECSKKVVEICGGLPLALKVLGSSLSGKSMVVWESVLKKLQGIPNGEVMNKLRISYESLQDDHDQNVFLHLACFFVGMDKDDVVRILDSCDFYADIAIENIIERCMVTIDKDNKVQMHHLIQSMGREIVSSESKDPNKFGRLLWDPNDSLKVLTEKKDTQTIEGLNLDMEMVEVDPAYNRPRMSNGEVSLKTGEFSRMHKLRLLKINQVQLNGSYGDTFPTGLRWLCWNQFSFDCLPNDFPLKSLVVLEMCYSRLKLLWKETQYLPLLKTLNLSHSEDLIKTPDFSHIPNLESLILKGCTNLVDLHESVGNLERLAHLNIEDCKNITKLPHFKNMMKFLKTIKADGVPIPQLVTTTEVLSCLLSQSLVKLSLVNCHLSDAHFPKGTVGLSALRNVNLSSNPITCLPDFIRSAPRLDDLTLRECELLTSLIRIPTTRVLDVTKSPLLEKITGQSLWRALEGISWNSNRNLVEFETWFKLEPIENVRQEVTEIFGPFNLQPTDTVVISAGVPTVWWERKTMPIQVLHEHGFVSTFLPGNNDITNDFMSYTRTRRSSISFTIPSLPNQSFQALNIFCLYTQSNIDTPRSTIDDLKDGFPQPLMATISNKIMGKKWWYAPMFFGVPDCHGGEDNILWLCHWNLAKDLNGGDRVTVSVFTGSELEVKECGVKLLYEEDVLHFSTQNVPEYWGMSFGMLDIRYMCWSTLALTYDEFSKRDWFKYLMQHPDDDHHEITDEEEQQEGDDIIEHVEKKEASVPLREFGSIEDCMDALEAMEGVDDEAYLKACEKFESSNMRKMFLKMSEGRRRAWLNSSKKIK